MSVELIIDDAYAEKLGQCYARLLVLAERRRARLAQQGAADLDAAANQRTGPAVGDASRNDRQPRVDAVRSEVSG